MARRTRRHERPTYIHHHTSIDKYSVQNEHTSSHTVAGTDIITLSFHFHSCTLLSAFKQLLFT